VKVSLERLDASGLRVELPGAADDLAVVRAAEGLSGALVHEGGRLRLDGVAAESLSLDALRLTLGALLLAAPSGATFAKLGLSLTQEGEHLELDLHAEALAATELTVTVGEVVVAGRLRLVNAHLSVRDGAGSLRAAEVELQGFRLRLQGVEVTSEAVSGVDVAIAWGDEGFALDARAITAPSLGLVTAALRLDAAEVTLTALSLDPRRVQLGQLAFARGEAALTLRVSRTPSPTSPPTSPTRASSPPRAAGSVAPAEPVVDWHVLDFLSGEIDVDVDVDLTVPLLGRRKAKHRFRVPVERGSIDYRALEGNLAALEDALLDFSVRDGGLVIERVNPLFPARGHGKPLVVWDLDEADLAIANANRVRLAVLHRARLAHAHDPSDAEPSSGGFALRTLALEPIDIHLALAPVDGPLGGRVRLRRLDDLTVRGALAHPGVDGAPPSRLRGEAAGLALGLAHLRLGTTGLDVTSLQIARVSSIEAEFLGLLPSRVQLALAGVALEAVRVTLGP
jgi:hypothetical protein